MFPYFTPNELVIITEHEINTPHFSWMKVSFGAVGCCRRLKLFTLSMRQCLKMRCNAFRQQHTLLAGNFYHLPEEQQVKKKECTWMKTF